MPASLGPQALSCLWSKFAGGAGGAGVGILWSGTYSFGVSQTDAWLQSRAVGGSPAPAILQPPGHPCPGPEPDPSASISICFLPPSGPVKQVPKKAGAALQSPVGAAAARLSKQLVTIETQLDLPPLKLPLAELRWAGGRWLA